MNHIANIVVKWFKQGVATSLMIFKIMIPITIIVKIFQETGLIIHIGNLLSPFMQLIGLPGETGLIWASAMIGNIFAGIITYLSIAPQLTVAQITVLSIVILIAHTLPVELVITQKSGAKIITVFLFRFIMGMVAGIILHHFYAFFSLLDHQSHTITSFISTTEKEGWGWWLLNELKHYFIIFCYITLLIALLDILKRIGLIDKFNKLLYPVLKVLGIGKEIIPITVVGMTLGLAYGGGLIIKEVQEHTLDRRQILYALLLMSLCHSIIEDSLLVISLGAHYSGILIFRVIFTFVIIFLIVKITRHWSDKKMFRWFYSRSIR